MTTCPSGHESASDDFCDVCGIRIGTGPAFTETGPVPSGSVPGEGAPAAPAEACPRCGAARAGQFCEACGYNFTVGTPAVPPPVTPPPVPPPSVTPPPVPPPSATPPPGTPAPAAPAPASAWTAVVTADRAYYDSVQAAGGPDAGAISFPAYCPERRFPLSGTEVRVGRRSVSRGIDPEIDLTGPPADPGVSRLHVVLVNAPDGTWSAVDPGSENGTLVNGREIPQGEPVPLRDGDRIHLGAWTALTISREA
jgi:hypothetical protein